MTSVENLVFCQNSKIDNSGRMIIENLFTTILLPFLPTQFSFSIVFTVLGINPKAEHNLKLIFKNKNTNEIVFDTNNIPINNLTSNNDVPLEFQSINFNINLQNLIFKDGGIYVAIVYFDENNIGEREIFVYAKQ